MKKVKKKVQKEHKLCNQPKKYRKWSVELMMDAMKAVADGLLSINKDAVEFGKPRSMLGKSCTLYNIYIHNIISIG